MTSKEYLKKKVKIEKRINRLNKTLTELHDQVDKPKKWRTATADDIVEGAVIFYDLNDNWYFQVVLEVLDAEDDFKAYTAEDGCRYGLNKASIAI